MDAKELTRELFDNICPRLDGVENVVRYLSDENAKLRLLVNDLRMDVQMLQKGGKQ